MATTNPPEKTTQRARSDRSQNGRSNQNSGATQDETRKQVESTGRAQGARKRPAREKYPNPTPRLSISKQALKKLRMVAVAYSHVEREFFSTEEAYQAEIEVEQRAKDLLQVMEEKLNVHGQLYPADEYFLTKLIVDNPDLVINLVDTLRGKDLLQTSVPGALEMVEIPYTGAGMRGLVIGNDRNMFKQLLIASGIPTPPYQFITRVGTKVNPDLGLPLIVKLNESGGSVGIDNKAVKETVAQAQKQVDHLISTYRIPVIVEKFVDGPEITAVVFEDSRKKHVFLGKKKFGFLPDGKHAFTSLESYQASDSYRYEPVEDEALVRKIEGYVTKAFSILHNKDYAKYDIRVDERDQTPYFTDCNPNTAFGPNLGLPFTEVLQTLYGVRFEKVLAAMLSKYAKKIKTRD